MVAQPSRLQRRSCKGEACATFCALKKIGIYGGTFDPIHHAHLILAREAMEHLQLERVVFVPAAISPHKLKQMPAPAAARVEMLRAALQGEKTFEVDDIEVNRPGPSFTIDTIEAFQERDPQSQIFYLLGSDNLPGLGTWHRVDRLRELVRFVVFNRGAEQIATSYVTIARSIDISGTEIRNRVARGQSIRYLVPPAVEEIIHRLKLYQEPARSPQKN